MIYHVAKFTHLNSSTLYMKEQISQNFMHIFKFILQTNYNCVRVFAEIHNSWTSQVVYDQSSQRNAFRICLHKHLGKRFVKTRELVILCLNIDLAILHQKSCQSSFQNHKEYYTFTLRSRSLLHFTIISMLLFLTNWGMGPLSVSLIF